MPADERMSREQVARLGKEIYQRQVRPTLRPEDDGKFVAVDITTGDFEVHEDDYTAVKRLRSRRPEAQIWLERAGQRTAHKIRRGR